MGSLVGREGPWHKPILCEANTNVWLISDWEWRAYVDRTYTRETVQGVADIDDVQLRAELALPLLPSTAALQQQQHQSGGGEEKAGPEASTTDVAVGRAVRVADGFITYGDVLLPQSQWENCAGSSWVLVGAYNTDGCACSQHNGELVQIERAADSEDVLCTATGKPAVKPQFHKCFAGRAFQIQEESPATGTGTKNRRKPAADGGEDKCGDRDQTPKRLLWRSSPDGKAEVNVLGIVADCDQEEWQPCELHFHKNFSRLTVSAHGPGDKTSRTMVLVLERLLSLESNLRFHGVDLIFDNNMDTYWALWGSQNAQEVVLHLARVDEQRLLLQLVYSMGYNGDMRPAALTVPVPLDQLRNLEPIVNNWQQFVRPLIFEDRMYSTDEEFANAMASWLMLDMALSSANCAALLAGTGFAIATVDPKAEGPAVHENDYPDDTGDTADWFPNDLGLDAVAAF